jgi:hypothetical protein
MKAQNLAILAEVPQDSLVGVQYHHVALGKATLQFLYIPADGNPEPWDLLLLLPVL